jgi:cobalt/nickel transport system ATP-binding protein
MNTFNENGLAITLQNVHYTYPDKTVAIEGISFDIKKGEKVALIGPNGAGKSTLITLLNGVLSGEGTIKIFGLLLEKKSIKSIRAKIGIVFQNPDDQLFCPTVFEDVAFGPKNFGFSNADVQHRVQVALKEVGLQGYEKRSSLHLSYGEKKLASIATILSSDPELIALDEPSSNLDPYHRRKIIDWIKRSNGTILMATHDLDMVAETAQRVLLLRKGKLISDGEVRKILTDQTLLDENQLELPLTLQRSPFSKE